MKKKLYISAHDYIEIDTNPNKQSLTTEIASMQRAFNFFSSRTFLQNPDPVLKKMGKDISVYKEIKSDSHVRACIRSRKAGVQSMLWEIDRGKSKSREAKLITQTFKKLKTRKIINSILEAPLFGYAPHEILWSIRNMNGKEYILPVDVKGKPQDWFVFSEEGELLFRSKENWNGEMLPDKKFLLPRQEEADDNPYGVPDLASVFWWATFKKGGIKFWLNFIEKYGTPYIVGKVPRGTKKEDKDDLLDDLDQMVQDAVAVIPDDSSVDIKEASGKSASSDLYNTFIDLCNAEISKAILGQTLTTQEGDSGSYSLGKVHLDVRNDIVMNDAHLVEETFNQLIAWIMEINFGIIDDLPEFMFYEEEDVDKDLAERDKIIVDMGFELSIDYMNREYGFQEGDLVKKEPPKPPPVIPQILPGQNPKLPASDQSEFEEQKNKDDLDEILDSFQDSELQKLLDPVLKPLFEKVKNSSGYYELQDELKKAFPKMNTSDFQEHIEKLMLIGAILGGHDAAKKE